MIFVWSDDCGWKCFSRHWVHFGSDSHRSKGMGRKFICALCVYVLLNRNVHFCLKYERLVNGVNVPECHRCLNHLIHIGLHSFRNENVKDAEHLSWMFYSLLSPFLFGQLREASNRRKRTIWWKKRKRKNKKKRPRRTSLRKRWRWKSCTATNTHLFLKLCIYYESTNKLLNWYRMCVKYRVCVFFFSVFCNHWWFVEI